MVRVEIGDVVREKLSCYFKEHLLRLVEAAVPTATRSKLSGRKEIGYVASRLAFFAAERAKTELLERNGRRFPIGKDLAAELDAVLRAAVAAIAERALCDSAVQFLIHMESLAT